MSSPLNLGQEIRALAIREAANFLCFRRSDRMGVGQKPEPPPRVRNVLEVAEILGAYIYTGDIPDWDTTGVDGGAKD